MIGSKSLRWGLETWLNCSSNRFNEISTSGSTKDSYCQGRRRSIIASRVRRAESLLDCKKPTLKDELHDTRFMLHCWMYNAVLVRWTYNRSQSCAHRSMTSLISRVPYIYFRFHII